MADQTPRLKLPFMSTAQVNKELTFNQLAAMVDALLSTTALDKDLSAPPASPADGDLYIVGPAPTGAWTGRADFLAYYVGGWQFIDPAPGWIVWVADESSFYRYNQSSTEWVQTLPIPVSNLVELLDVDAATPGAGEDGYVLTWNNATSKFVLSPGPSSLVGLSDVNAAGITDGQTLTWDATAGEFVPGSVLDSFLSLTDTPNLFTGSGGMAVFVNGTEDGLEFAPVEPGGAGAATFLELSDTPGNYVGQAGRVPVVNEAEDALEFGSVSELVGGLPPGGGINFVLRKLSTRDFDAEWVDLNEVVPVIPVGGLTAQVLAKASDNDGDVEWITVPAIPTGGTTGQFLRKTGDGDAELAWQDADPVNEVPDGGTDGQVLTNTAGGYAWQDLPDIPVIPPYSVPFGFTLPPEDAEVMLIHVFAESVTFPNNFAGAQGYVGINPTATTVFTVKKNGAAVGAISISPSGTVTFDTTDTTVSFAPGDVLQIEAQATADVTIGNCAFTLIAERD